ncbi:MAG: STAS domain-containing protein [Firmicutes bacterium]|nr:STAS domain-containing protein [Bacillota bacterium]
MLNIRKDKNDGSLTIFLEGKLDTVTAQELDAAVKEDIDDVTELVFDMNELRYISSAGLRVLLGAQKVMNEQGEMRVVKPNEIICEIFEDTGFYNILTIED